MNSSMDKTAIGAIDVQGLDKTEHDWQLKQPLVTRLALNWQLTSLVCKVSHYNQF